MKKYLFIKMAVISIFLSLPAKAVDLSSGGSRNNVIVWNNVALEAVRQTTFAPPMTARALSIMHTGIFDAWAAYDPVAIGTQLGDTLQRPEQENTLANKNEAISYAAYLTLADLFPTQISLFDQVMTSLGYDPQNTSSTAAGIGNLSAQALLNFRHNDGSNQLGTLNPSGQTYSQPLLDLNYTAYTPVNTPDTIIDPDRWQPLRLPNGSVQQFLVPHWGSVTPFALSTGSQLRPTQKPISYQSDPDGFKAQAQEIYDISKNITDEQKAIARYWADGPTTETPPGHWNLLAQYISERDNHDLDEDVKMFFALDTALFDASIAAWDIKRAFDYVRPQTAINSLIDPTWKPYINTPPFPEYVSGHSTFSAAAAEILKQFTGSDRFGYSYTDSATGIALSWNSFSEASSQAGMSRLYAGIHFMDGNVIGSSLGQQVAEVNWAKTQSYISGKSVPESSSVLGVFIIVPLGAISTYKRQTKQVESKK